MPITLYQAPFTATDGTTGTAYTPTVGPHFTQLTGSAWVIDTNTLKPPANNVLSILMADLGTQNSSDFVLTFGAIIPPQNADNAWYFIQYVQYDGTDAMYFRFTCDDTTTPVLTGFSFISGIDTPIGTITLGSGIFGGTLSGTITATGGGGTLTMATAYGSLTIASPLNGHSIGIGCQADTTSGPGYQQIRQDFLNLTVPAVNIPASITGPVVQTSGTVATGTLNPHGASISATDFAKVILGGQATASAAITGLTVGNTTSSGLAYSLTLSGLVVPGITLTVNFSDGAFTNSNGPNDATGVLTGTNSSTTLDLIIDSGTLSGTTATVDFDPVNVPADMWGGSVTLWNNNASVGTFITGSTAGPVIGGDLITLHGYLSDGTLIASGTLFTVTQLVRLGSNIVAAMSGSLTMAPPSNAFANSTWRDTTASVNSLAFISQSGSNGTWSISSGFTAGNSWGFSTVPTYVMNMTGILATGNLTPGTLTLLSQSPTAAGFLLGSANGDGTIYMTFQSSTSNGVAWLNELTLPNQDFSGLTYTTDAPPVASTWLYREQFASEFDTVYSNTITLQGVFPVLAGTISHTTSGLLLGMV